MAPTTLYDEAESTLDLHIDELIAENKRPVPGPQTFERRRKPRLQEAFPARRKRSKDAVSRGCKKLFLREYRVSTHATCLSTLTAFSTTLARPGCT